MKLTNQQLIMLRDGLCALDGAKINGEIRPFKLGGVTRLTLAKNINRLRPHYDAYVEARNGLVKELSNDAGVVAGDKLSEFHTQENEMLQSEVEVDLIEIAVTDLNLEDNDIVASVIAAISPIIKDL